MLQANVCEARKSHVAQVLEAMDRVAHACDRLESIQRRLIGEPIPMDAKALVQGAGLPSLASMLEQIPNDLFRLSEKIDAAVSSLENGLL